MIIYRLKEASPCSLERAGSTSFKLVQNYLLTQFNLHTPILNNYRMKTFLLHLSFAPLFSLTLTLPSFSQDIIFNTVSPTIGNFHGLLGITQDKNGYMWIASENGLYRYDGYSFKMYVNDPSNPNSLAESHLETDYATHDGLIWIATWTTGLDRLDPRTGIFSHFRYDAKTPSSISSDLVRAILEDHEGTLWIGTHGGLDRFDPKTGMFQHYQHDAKDSSSLSCNKVRALYEDREGNALGWNRKCVFGRRR